MFYAIEFSVRTKGQYEGGRYRRWQAILNVLLFYCEIVESFVPIGEHLMESLRFDQLKTPPRALNSVEEVVAMNILK